MSRKYVFLGIVSILFVCFQNFSPLSEEDLRTLETIKQMKELQAQNQKPKYAVPRKGRDLASVSSDLVEQQGNIWLNGADQRFLDDVNERIEGWFRSTDEKEMAAKDNGSSTESDDSVNSEVQRFRFARLNEMEYKFEDNGLLSCTLEGDGAHIDYSKSLSRDAHVGIAHKSSENQTQVMIKYNF